MLCITRKRGEAVMVSDSIRIVVVDAKDGRVRLGIEAKKDVRIERKEKGKAGDLLQRNQ